MIEYRFRVPSIIVFTLYLYSKILEYRFRVPSYWSECSVSQDRRDLHRCCARLQYDAMQSVSGCLGACLDGEKVWVKFL
jgi:hypothetical protein